MHALVNPVNSLPWQHRFAGLGDTFSSRVAPTPVHHLHWIAQNTSLATELGLPASLWGQDEWLQALGGSTELPGSQCLASVYSGHQFGVWAGQLGDGRALSLGEINTPMGIQTLQLKGAGMTPYSRMADGRAVLRSSIREYLCSEAMHGLGIPTTRALALVGSPDKVLREELETAAVVTRVAPSFVRFGHVEHFAAKGQTDALRRLTDFVIEHHFPHLLPVTGAQRYLALLGEVTERTASLLAHWQSVGFCHGVMNTDNMSILGLTIDYGPFQFLDGYDPGHICNHSDSGGRYAFNKQPNIAYWNLFRLGQALLPLIGEQELALAALESYKTVFPAALEARMCAKLGLPAAADSEQTTTDRRLIEDILKLLAAERVDYTIFWRRLSHAQGGLAAEPVRDLFLDRAAVDAWLLQYSERMSHTPQGLATDLMLKTNPKFVLRNHLGELAIRAARQMDFSQVQTLLTVLESPFDEHPQFDALAGFPPEWAGSIAISCSS